MTKNYNEIYKQKLQQMQESTINSNISDQLAIKAISEKRLKVITDKMTDIVGKKVWEDFNFRTGKILGILRFIAQNPQYRQELLEVTNLTQDYVDLYYKVCGNLPYLNTFDNTINFGRPMHIENAKDFIKAVAYRLGVIVEDDDLYDITEERRQRLYNATMEKIHETMKHNAQHGDTIPVKYDE